MGIFNDPSYARLLKLFEELASESDPILQKYQFDRAWKIAKCECGLTLLSSFRSMFEEYKKVQSTHRGTSE